MRVHVIRHVPFEGPEAIGEWAIARGHTLSESFAITEEYPPVGATDLLVVMGGPMGADDEVLSPWLVAEKNYIAAVMAADTRVLGVCLGAQILAEVLGGNVRRSAEREIGWYPVGLTDVGRTDPVFSAFPDGLVVGHWHGDTFELPLGVQPSLSSELTPNQAFSMYGGRAVGLQCHLEWSAAAVAALVENCGDDLVSAGPWVVDGGQMLEGARTYSGECRDVLFALLDRIAALQPDAGLD